MVRTKFPKKMKRYGKAYCRNVKNPGSMPPVWNDDRSRQAFFMASLLGATDVQIAKIMDVSEHTITYWKRTKPEFLVALNKGKLTKDEQVERSLLERALGYSHPDVHISNYQGEITVTDIMKHYPPSEVACIFWLKNRQRARWADVQKSSISINLKHIELTEFTREQLLLMESVGMKLLPEHKN